MLLHILFRIIQPFSEIHDINQDTLSRLQNSIFIEYMGEIGVALPVIYFVPLDMHPAENQKLFQSSFLTQFQIDYTTAAGASLSFKSYFKPGITPLPQSFLPSETEKVWNKYMHAIQNELRRLPK